LGFVVAVDNLLTVDIVAKFVDGVVDTCTNSAFFIDLFLTTRRSKCLPSCYGPAFRGFRSIDGIARDTAISLDKSEFAHFTAIAPHTWSPSASPF
jgi:hypothetical protein